MIQKDTLIVEEELQKNHTEHFDKHFIILLYIILLQMFIFRHYEQDYKNLTYQSSVLEKFIHFILV